MQLHYSQIDISDVYVSGDVTIHPQAVIAPGVVLQAAPHSRIVISAGTCIGMGAVLKAYQGAIKIKNGAVLGAGVLIIGSGTIGSNACVGSATTVFDTSVDAGDIIPPGSLLGDPSRQVEKRETPPSPAAEPPPSQSMAETTRQPEKSAQNPNGSAPVSSPSQKSQVFGQVYVNELLVKLFPHRNSLDRPQQNQ